MTTTNTPADILHLWAETNEDCPLTHEEAARIERFASALLERFGRPAMPADAEDTKRLDFLAENARTVRRADDGRSNLIVWDHDFPNEGAGLRSNMNAMIDSLRRRIEGESHG